jgi:hypothetical protein
MFLFVAESGNQPPIVGGKHEVDLLPTKRVVASDPPAIADGFVVCIDPGQSQSGDKPTRVRIPQFDRFI